MDQSIDEMLNLDERNNAVLVGLILGFVAGLIAAAIAQSSAGTQARQKVTGAVGEMDLGAVQSRVPDSLQGGATKVQDALAAGRSRVTDIVNQSPLPVTIGPDGEADPVEAESKIAAIDVEPSQATEYREPSESRSPVSDE